MSVTAASTQLSPRDYGSAQSPVRQQKGLGQRDFDVPAGARGGIRGAPLPPASPGVSPVSSGVQGLLAQIRQDLSNGKFNDYGSAATDGPPAGGGPRGASGRGSAPGSLAHDASSLAIATRTFLSQLQTQASKTVVAGPSGSGTPAATAPRAAAAKTHHQLRHQMAQAIEHYGTQAAAVSGGTTSRQAAIVHKCGGIPELGYAALVSIECAVTKIVK